MKEVVEIVLQVLVGSLAVHTGQEVLLDHTEEAGIARTEVQVGGSFGHSAVVEVEEGWTQIV